MKTTILLCASVFVLSCAVAAAQSEYKYYNLSGAAGVVESWASDINDQGCIVLFAVLDDGTSYIYGWKNGQLVNYPVPPAEYEYFYAHYVSDNNVFAGVGWNPEIQHESVMIVSDSGFVAFPWAEGCGPWPFIAGVSSRGSYAVGDCQTVLDPEFYTVPVLYDSATGQSIALSLPDGAPADSSGYGDGVNEQGVVVGILNYTGEVDRRAFIYKDGETLEVTNAIGGSDIGFQGLNESNLAVGSARDEYGVFFAVGYDIETGVTTVLGPGGADAVNDRGWASGGDSINFILYQTVYKDGQTFYLTEYLPEVGYSFSSAFAINNYGWVIGTGWEWFDDVAHGWLLVPLYPKGDYDGDDDVDFQDFGKFQECFAAEPYQGPEGGLHVGCSVFDFDDDIDLDSQDFAAFQAAFTGPTAPDLNPTGPG